MKVKDLQELLAAAIEAGLIDPEEELSIALDYGEVGIIGEIDFLDAQNLALVCSCWGTTEDTVQVCDECDEEFF